MIIFICVSFIPCLLPSLEAWCSCGTWISISIIGGSFSDCAKAKIPTSLWPWPQQSALKEIWRKEEDAINKRQRGTTTLNMWLCWRESLTEMWNRQAREKWSSRKAMQSNLANGMARIIVLLLLLLPKVKKHSKQKRQVRVGKRRQGTIEIYKWDKGGTKLQDTVPEHFYEVNLSLSLCCLLCPGDMLCYNHILHICQHHSAFHNPLATLVHSKLHLLQMV